MGELTKRKWANSKTVSFSRKQHFFRSVCLLNGFGFPRYLYKQTYNTKLLDPGNRVPEIMSKKLNMNNFSNVSFFFSLFHLATFRLFHFLIFRFFKIQRETFSLFRVSTFRNSLCILPAWGLAAHLSYPVRIATSVMEGSTNVSVV